MNQEANLTLEKKFNAEQEENQKEPIPDVRTTHLMLREITIEDAPTIVRLRSEPRVYRFFCSPHAISLEEHLQWYQKCYLKDWNRRDLLAWVDNLPVGVFGIIKEEENPLQMEVNFWLVPEAWGKGYAREGVIALLDWAKDNWKISIARAIVHRENSASRKFVERLAFEKCAEENDFMVYCKTL